MLRSSPSSLKRAAGFGLVEIMVALAIGMFAAVVILQVFSLSEERNRTSISGGDAQSNGALSFYQLQSNVLRAGYGMNAVNMFNCSITWQIASGNYLAKTLRLAPVTINPVDGTGAAIIPAGDPNTDTLLVMYGNGDNEPEGNRSDTTASPTYTVQMPSSFSVGDRVIAVPAACAADLILDRITSIAPTTVTVAMGASGVSLFNLGRGPNGLPTATGPNGPTVLAYAIRGANLTVCDFIVNDCSLAANTGDATVWEPVASNIVSLRALYGWDNGGATAAPYPVMDGIVDDYNSTTPATSCEWARVSAIRIALVARSAQFEKVGVTTAAPVWDGSAVSAIDLTKKPDGSANADWQHYRYKMFQAVMPLRNIAWMGVPTGC
ncbi:MAG: Type fimbrial biosis protein PilW [Pseudomonadota bacterium]|jgi:type IV pilus assembly protein PilW